MIDHEALKAAHPQFRLGHSQGLQDGRDEARRDALAEAAEEADRFTCGGCGMDGMAGTAIRALIDAKEPSMKPNEHIILEISRERKRQIEKEGWTAQHDDDHVSGELAGAAACYAMTSVKHFGAMLAVKQIWPFSESWWKPRSVREDLIRAGALIVAEIERIDRASDCATHNEPAMEAAPCDCEVPPVDRTARELSGGKPETDDHREINHATGLQKGYVVLTENERRKGFVRPFRDAYRHLTCGGITTMARDIAETYARDPYFYAGTFCSTCRSHFPVGDDGEFTWYEMDGREGPKVGT